MHQPLPHQGDGSRLDRVGLEPLVDPDGLTGRAEEGEQHDGEGADEQDPVAARWVADPAKPLPLLGGATTAAADRQQRRVLLFANEWEVQYFEKQNPTFGLLAESPVA